MTTPQDLQGKARRRYETWRALGMTESAALGQVTEDGLAGPSEAELSARVTRVFGGPLPSRPVTESARQPVTAEEAFQVLLDHAFDRSVSAARLQEAETVADLHRDRRDQSAQTLTARAVEAIREAADREYRLSRTKGEAQCLIEAWQRADARLPADQRRQLREAMAVALPQCPGAPWLASTSTRATEGRRVRVVPTTGRALTISETTTQRGNQA